MRSLAGIMLVLGPTTALIVDAIHFGGPNSDPAYMAGVTWVLAIQMTACGLYYSLPWKPIALKLIGHRGGSARILQLMNVSKVKITIPEV